LGALRLQARAPASAGEFQLDCEIGRGEKSGSALRPLDDAQRIRTEVLP
jgi:hypothetical protein